MKMFYFILCSFTVFYNALIHAQAFTNVTALQGINVSNPYIDVLGTGLSFYDFNKDGWDDLSFAVIGDTQRLIKE